MISTLLPWPRFLRKLARRVQQRAAGPATGLILLYHRVVEVDRDPQQLCVTPERFAEHLGVMRRWGRPAPLEEFANPQPRAQHERPRIATTFDDGYADNYLFARPLLEKYGVPATVFVATGYLDHDIEFWWDELDRLLLDSAPLPAECSLRAGPQTIRCRLDNVARYDGPHDARHRHWHVLCKNDPTPRHTLYRTLCNAIRTLPVEVREQTLSELREWAGRPAAGRRSHRAMTRDEVRRLDNSTAVSVGAHTVRHPVLSSLSRQQQQTEIRDSKRQLEDLLGRPIATFSYPFGNRRDYNADSLELVSQLGFSLACANEQGSVRPQDDHFQLKRRLVRNWTGDEFERRLKKWLRR